MINFNSQEYFIVFSWSFWLKFSTSGTSQCTLAPMSARSTRLLTDNAKGAAVATVSKKRVIFWKIAPSRGQNDPSLWALWNRLLQAGYREHQGVRSMETYGSESLDFSGVCTSLFPSGAALLPTDGSRFPHFLSQATLASTRLRMCTVQSPSLSTPGTAKSPWMCDAHASTFFHLHYPTARPSPGRRWKGERDPNS